MNPKKLNMLIIVLLATFTISMWTMDVSVSAMINADNPWLPIITSGFWELQAIKGYHLMLYIQYAIMFIMAIITISINDRRKYEQ